MTPLITPHDLRALLGAPDPLLSQGPTLSQDLVLLDATVLLPGERYDPQERFLAAHLPGARRFDIDAFSDPEGALPHMVPSQGRFARLAAALGVGGASRVVLYDQAGLVGAARGWWLFGLFGHDTVQVLDGGLQGWRGLDYPIETGPIKTGPIETGPIETGEPSPAADARFTPRLRSERLVGLGDMIRIAAGERAALVVDARSRGRWAGTAPEPRAGLPGGHIPGSASLPFTALLTDDRRMLPPAALRDLFAAAGIGPQSSVVTTCGSGLTASVLSLGLSVAGYPPGALFDGSWTEWASHPELPRGTAGDQS
ncbi:sulfurtransferase [Lichenicoccus sp.]|uniref:sulfurtransferase n=1 Tax=Lichenicoccus sp. TaxID=2781899 RepID=UPI003D1230D1